MYIGVSLVDNKTIQALNKKHLGRDYATDVLSFNYLDDEGPKKPSSKVNPAGDYLGDVIVSTEKAREQAKSYGNTYEQEVADLVTHGVLHLLGVHHKGDDCETSRRSGKSRRKI
jgi:probable rRNA maturation factor